jgi:hypothetical protein
MSGHSIGPIEISYVSILFLLSNCLPIMQYFNLVVETTAAAHQTFPFQYELGPEEERPSESPK